MHNIGIVSDDHQKMLNGSWHLPTCPKLTELRTRTHTLLHEFNQLGPTNPERSQAVLSGALGHISPSSTIIAPAFFDYGIHTFIGEHSFINTGVTILDSAPVRIDDRVLLGPNCQLITVGHPVDDVQQRRDLWEHAAPIHLEDDVWLGAGVIVVPGVTIGSRSVIGAGSVVTRNIPADSVAVGNPARVIRTRKPN